jgi:hypothetical protein
MLETLLDGTAWPVRHNSYGDTLLSLYYSLASKSHYYKKGCVMQKNDPFLVLAVIDRHQRCIFSVGCHYVANSKDASLLP